MGNAIFGSNAAQPNTNVAQSGQAGTWWPSAGLGVSSEYMYIDGAFVWGHPVTGSCNCVSGIYLSGGNMLGVASGTATAASGSSGMWQGGTWTGPNYVQASSGITLRVGVWFSAAWKMDSGGDAGGYLEVNGASIASTFSGASSNPFGAAGTLHSYISYFKACSISAITSTPVAPGQSFTITGQSFTAGITGIDVNGTAVTTYTVNSDTQITATVPTGATTGPVHVNTYAGNATSASNLLIAGGYVFRTGAWVASAGVFVERTAVQTQASGVDVLRTGVWTPGG